MPRVVIPILVGLFAGVLFVTSNVTAQHDPQPHGVPIAVSHRPAATLQRKLGSHYVVTRYASAQTALRERRAYAGFDAHTNEVLTASANGTNVSMSLQHELAVATGVSRHRDVVPLRSGDRHGLSLQQIVLGTIIAGFMAGVLMAQLALGEPLWQRGLAWAAFAVAFGLLVALVIGPILEILTGHFVVIALWLGASALVISLSVTALARLTGQFGIPLAMLVFLILGNPSAGASSPTEYLPWLYRTAGPYLPPNAAAQGLLGSTYFEHATILRPVLVLASWGCAAAAAIVVLDRTRGSRKALAHEAAGAASDRADREAQPVS